MKKILVISCREKSQSGLKSHYQRLHTFCCNSFQTCLTKGSNLTSRKRCLEEERSQKVTGSKKKQLTKTTPLLQNTPKHLLTRRLVDSRKLLARNSVPSLRGDGIPSWLLFWITLNSLFCLEHRVTIRRQTIVLRILDF